MLKIRKIIRGKRKTNKQEHWFLAILFIFVGVLLLGYTQIILMKQNEVKKWPVTMGIVENVDTYQNSKNKSSIHNYGLRVSYKYNINKKLYSSPRVTVTGNYESTTLSEIKKLQQHFKSKKQIKVFFNPKNPSESLLIKSYFNQELSSYITFGIVLVILGFIIIGLNIYKKIKRK